MMEIPRDEMLGMAKSLIYNAYAPYSKIRVASVVYACRRFFPGVNVENASYGLTICAERNAIARMITEGCQEISGILVYSEDVEPIPCGACLQVISEFSKQDIPILVAYKDQKTLYKLSELFPKAFRLRVFSPSSRLSRLLSPEAVDRILY